MKRELIHIFDEKSFEYHGWYSDLPNIIGSGKTLSELELDIKDSIRIVEENKLKQKAFYYEEERELTRKVFDLDQILSFQMEHDVQIIRGEDWQYMCYIDKNAYGSSLTPMAALVFGIKQYKEHGK